MVVGINTDIGCRLEALPHNVARMQARMLHKGTGRGKGIHAAAADGNNAVFGFNDISGSGNDERF